MTDHQQPGIGEYAFIGDKHSVALVGPTGSIDWCCMPRVDSSSCFGRLLDWERGGYCQIVPAGTFQARHEYAGETMVLVTTFTTGTGEARLLDAFTLRAGGREDPHRELVRIVEGVSGEVELRARIAPRFGYGALRPWLRHCAGGWAAIGGTHGLLIRCGHDLTLDGHHDLATTFTVRAGERVRLTISHHQPETLDEGRQESLDPDQVDRHLEETLDIWRRWAGRATYQGPDRDQVVRSALVLEALTNAPTGAISAAPTTSLPERAGGQRNWDYRYSWVRDSALSLRSLAEVGFHREADAFRRFMQRTSAGHAREIQIMYGVGGQRHLPEWTLDLAGYRGATPVRIGNAAAQQLQLDVYGELMQLAWGWHERGHRMDDDYWRFLTGVVDVASERWREADRGIWEIRGEPQHFVHSKVMCWQAVDRGAALAEAYGRTDRLQDWRRTAGEIRASIEANGVDPRRGCFVQAYGSDAMDSALLLIPGTGFVAAGDPLMVHTVDAIREDLEEEGLLLRYRTEHTDDGLGADREGRFLACTFWLAECLAAQGRTAEAQAVFDRVRATANDLGLFAEEYDPEQGEPLGNFPQGLSHLSHIAAAAALARAAEGSQVGTGPSRSNRSGT